METIRPYHMAQSFAEQFVRRLWWPSVRYLNRCVCVTRGWLVRSVELFGLYFFCKTYWMGVCGVSMLMHECKMFGTMPYFNAFAYYRLHKSHMSHIAFLSSTQHIPIHNQIFHIPEYYTHLYLIGIPFKLSITTHSIPPTHIPAPASPPPFSRTKHNTSYMWKNAIVCNTEGKKCLVKF